MATIHAAQAQRTDSTKIIIKGSLKCSCFRWPNKKLMTASRLFLNSPQELSRNL